jgi:hypothetical protein
MIAGFREDAVGFISLLPTMTRPRAEALVAGAETHVKAQVRSGVLAALPEAEVRAKKILYPVALGVGALSGLALLFSIVAIRRSRR